MEDQTVFAQLMKDHRKDLKTVLFNMKITPQYENNASVVVNSFEDDNCDY